MKQLEIDVLLDQPSQSLLRDLLEMAPVAASIAIDGKVVYANPACARLWAYDAPAKMLGLSFFDLIAPESMETVIDLWRQRAEGSDAWTYDLLGLRADGSRFQYRCTSVSLVTIRGKATIAYFEDIDEETDKRG